MRVVGEAPLLPGHLGQRHPVAAHLLRHGHRQVTRVSQFVEVLLEEAVLSIVSGSALKTALQDVFR